MDQDNILSLVPGELIVRALNSLPPPDAVLYDEEEIDLTVPDFGAVVVTCRKMTRKRGESTTVYWLAVKAVRRV